MQNCVQPLEINYKTWVSTTTTVWGHLCLYYCYDVVVRSFGVSS